MPDALASTFHESVEEGAQRVHRSWPSLLATGAVGGIDVSVGVLATLLVLHVTENEIAAALAFSIGFIALTLANSELFTENFLVPIAAVAARKATLRDVGRLWIGTVVMNLIGGVLMMAIVVVAFPELADAAVEKGLHYMERGYGWEAFASAVLAGIVITLMTWMQQGAGSMGAKIVAAVVASFLLSFGHLSHVIVASLETIAGLYVGAPYGWFDWASKFWLWAAGNAVGGIGLVTVLRLVQVGPDRLRAEQERELEVEGEEAAKAARASLAS